MYISDKDKLFCSKIDDAAELCLKRQKPYFFSFMSERKQYIADNYLKSICFQNYSFFGGYENSERKILGLFYDDTVDFPVSAVEFAYRKCDKLSHRDFLGALMSLGIERETVGDILVEDGRCVVFVKSEIKNYIVSQIYKIGRVGVRICEADINNLPQGRGIEELGYTVSSMRLDNIVAAITGFSREKTKSQILSGTVCLNYSETRNISQNVCQDDCITVRGKGKFIIKAVVGYTKKQRIKISIIHFR